MKDYHVRISQRGDQAITVLVAQLHQRGFHVTRTFSLHDSWTRHNPCPCPHHGMAECACDYSVLLVYRPVEKTTGLPGIITVHHHDGVTWFTLLPVPWTDEAAQGWHEQMKDSMVAAVFSDETDKELA